MRHAISIYTISTCTLLVSCYLSHGLEERDTGRLDAAPAIDAGHAPACEWVPGEVVQLTFPPGDETPLALQWTGERFVVLWGNTNDPVIGPGTHLLALDTEGRPADEPALLFSDRPTSVYGGASIAGSNGRVAAIAWDRAHGCRFAPISTRGVPFAEQTLDVPRCESLRANGDELEMVASERDDGPHALVRLDFEGNRVARSPALDVFEGAFWWSRAVLSDRSGLVLAMREGVRPSEIRAQQVSSSLEPLAPASRWRALDRPASRIGLARRREGALVGWLEGDDSDSQERSLMTAALDREGNLLGEPLAVTDRIFYRDAGWTMTAFEDLHLAVAVEDLDRDRRGESTRLWLVPIDSDARPLSAAIALHDGLFVRSPIVRAHPGGALVVFLAQAPATAISGEIFALPIRCAR